MLKVIHQKQRKSNAGRKPHDVTLMFKMLVLQALYNLSDDQAEFQVRDRLSLQRFLGLSPEDPVPDAKTLWLFREQLALCLAALVLRFASSAFSNKDGDDS